MGLLDEAIRQHLDLRRRHGADPEEVAREELDALAPVERDPRPVRSGVAAGADAPNQAADDALSERPRFARDRTQNPDRESEDVDGPVYTGAPALMEETAEIDMRAVLGALEDAMSGEEGTGDAPIRRSAQVAGTAPVAAGARSAFDFERDEDPLAWETPAPRVRRVERAASERGGREEWPAGASG